MSGAAQIREEQEETDVFTYADLIVEYLSQLGVDCVFGVPGGAIEPLFNALARSERRGGPRIVVARHEAGAAFMADGYARENGKIGVCCATTGPGATNLITGVSGAYADNTPMLVITAQTPLPKFGRRALQDSSCAAIDTVGMFRYCTRYNSLVSHQEQMEHKLISAIMATRRIPAGPVHISIPSDVLRATVSQRPQIRVESLMHKFTLSDKEALVGLIRELAKAERVALFLGDGCAEASEQIMAFAELINAPFVTGPMGKRWVDETHRLYRGVYGFGGHQSAKELLEDRDGKLDLVLAVGAALGELGTSGWAVELMNHKLIHIDYTPEHFTRSPMAKLHVCGYLPSVFQRLIDEVKEGKFKWGKHWQVFAQPLPRNINGCRVALNDPTGGREEAVILKPQRVFTHLSRVLPPGSRFFVDAGNAWAWSIHYYQRPESDGKYHIAMGLGAMAWSIGAVIGSALADKERHPHVCVTGDGSYLMSAQEITVALQQKLPIVFLVLNDGVLGMVMHGQRLGGAEPSGFELGNVNFAAMARAMGVEGIVVDNPDKLEELDFEGFFLKDGPTLIDLRIDPDEVPPMMDRVKGLAKGTSATPGG
ncbi:thiamine pyrophosphate-binding protein [Bowmanella dokdonensis]|uniref:Thiamine pyrophosphate-binding protein n=1 Tax=Bowmanella dokdonensis TaxID=751969 RepID=A0A939DM16_9ALTE|nr:thiamine pyrophosphate-binding protein [Bowmanella dokdonensis]MBN7824620.1 thiamine pyrophosphate-binding protein [Bowmanella dokdonensis]